MIPNLKQQGRGSCRVPAAGVTACSCSMFYLELQPDSVRVNSVLFVSWYGSGILISLRCALGNRCAAAWGVLLGSDCPAVRCSIQAYLHLFGRGYECSQCAPCLAVLCLKARYRLSVQTTLQATGCSHLAGRDPQEVYSVPACSPLRSCPSGTMVP